MKASYVASWRRQIRSICGCGTGREPISSTTIREARNPVYRLEKKIGIRQGRGGPKNAHTPALQTKVKLYR
jgi:hypothetical protein